VGGSAAGWAHRRKGIVGVTRGFKPLHPLLPLAGRPVGVLRTIMQMLLFPMFHTREEFSLGSSLALEFVGHDHTQEVGQALEQRADELLGRWLIPAALHQDIQYVPLLLYCPPQRVMFAPDHRNTSSICPLSLGWGRQWCS